MKRHLSLLLLLWPLWAISQDFQYRSAENPLYWMNRKPNAAYWQQDVHYRIQARLNDETDVVSGNELLTYYNNSPDTLKEIYFHLYQNAFVKGGYLERLNLANGFKQKFGKYEAAGLGTAVRDLKVNGKMVVPEIDFSIMHVALPEPLLPGASLEVTINFETYFDDGGNQRRRMKMFKDGFGNKQYDGVHWYPRICVYDRKFGWETDQHLGKEFYGDFGQYDVELTLPSHYLVEATGELQNEEEVMPPALRARLDLRNFATKPWEEKPSEILPKDGTTKTWKFRSVNTHDFAWIADPTFRFGEVQLPLPGNPRGKVRCIAVVQEQHASGWQDAAPFLAKIIETYSRDIGVFAYPKMIVADARDGMEYPMLTLDGGRSPGYYGLFAHEVGHNWFFGMVGNNETYRASLDEGFTQFLTHWCMSRLTKPWAKPANPNSWAERYYRPLPLMDQTVYLGYLRDAMNHDDMPLNTHSDDFNGALNHGGGYGHVYYKTATMLYNLQYVLGDELFQKAIQHYFNQWKIAHPYFEDFRNSIIQYTHVDLNWFFDQWMETTKVIDYAVSDVRSAGKDSLRITLLRKGGMQMPVDLRVITKTGDTSDYVVPNTYFAKAGNATVLPVWRGWSKLNRSCKVTVPVKGPVKDVLIDPSFRLADINQTDNSINSGVLFTFDHQINNPSDRRNYILKWRPELWYNAYDGMKTGLHLNGNYMNQKNVFKATVWYNTGLLIQRDAKLYSKENAVNAFDYSLTLQHRIIHRIDFNTHLRQLDGIQVARFGLDFAEGNTNVKVYVKAMYRDRLYYLPGAGTTSLTAGNFSPNVSSVKQLNQYLAVEFERAYQGRLGSAKLFLGMKFTHPLSDFQYLTQQFQLTHHVGLGKLDLKTRWYAAHIDGSSIAPESQIYLAGNNPEGMADSKYYRSVGLMPADDFLYGATTNHFHSGGGLNLRGYAGYMVPVNKDFSQYYLYRGNTGAAVNAELEFGRLLPLKLGRLNRYFQLMPYLFGDAGFLSASSNTFLDHSNLPTNAALNTGLMADAGLGITFTIKKWGVLDEPKPLVIRLDAPLFLSTAPYADPGYLKMRWVLGIGRCF